MEPVKPKSCPICKLESESHDIFGEPSNFLLELVGVEAKQILLRGWVCSDGITKGVFGTVIRIRDSDDSIIDMDSPDHVYLIMKGDGIVSIV